MVTKEYLQEYLEGKQATISCEFVVISATNDNSIGYFFKY